MTPARIDRSRRFALFAAAAFLAAGTATAQQKPASPTAPGPADRTAEVDKVFAWATPENPGCTCAVSLHGHLIINRAYGSANLETKTPLTTGMVFDAGSLLKQFVAAAVLILADEKRLSLSDDARTYLPELRDFGHTITVQHLITHTSGLRDWPAMLPLSAGNDDALTLILRQRGLNCVPGEEWSYSSSGFVLAREVVARVSGMSFADFARTRMFEPLGMKSTTFAADINAARGERALAYDKEGGAWRPAMLLERERGGGGIFSTSADLVTWNDALTRDRLGAFVSAKLQEPVRLNNGRVLNYGHGLMLGTYRGAKELWHTGSADGYKSFLGRYPEQGLSIAIMCNSGDGTDRTAFAHRIFDIFAPDAPKDQSEDGPPPPIPAGVDLTRRAGLFFSETDHRPLTLAVFRDKWFRIAGGPGLVVVDADHFRRWGASAQFMSADAFEVRFVSPDRFELRSMEGVSTFYRRAQAWTPAPADLKAFSGRFRSDELNAVFVSEARPDGLTMHLEHEPARSLTLTPVDPDAFQFSGITIRFQRDASGLVTGFDFGNPLIRKVFFAKLGGE